ncbi:hypothetical protein BCR33DRAFT_746394 [Rhizoclosmatium globosum]|uniref:Uncharacterized protein n=1 Tax=Rhizoclosmatium globosum TaxID=329046 RepID=A0A1Y2AWF6_9FUNG|nr:hypothetical protein BCR33DRAFT_746394 [Rhizoclosmatium globosum]|eukprot:ORY26816.1 hypothetical protein BCR33DRAFT_746394 [Rhizoclosmatium globosum]
MHTTYPVPYKCNSFFVLDFPGMGGNNEFGKFTAQFAEICTNIVVFLPPRMNLQQADIDVLQKVQAFEARVLVLLHRWGTTSADDINFTDTKRILDAAGSKFRKFDFHLSELDPGYWEDYKKSFLREKDVWDIKKVREWIRSMALLKDFDELPDSNAIWDNSCNQWVDKITDGQAIMKEIIDNALEDFEYLDIFVTMRKEWTLDCLDCGVWNAQLCKKALIQAEGSRNGAKTILKRQECARRLAVNGISEEELLQFQFLDLIISMKQEWSTKEGQWNTKTCMNALRESAGSRAEALRCLQREERLRHLVEDGISLEQLLQFKYLESLESMKKDWSEDDGVWNVRRCMQALEKSNGNLKKLTYSWLRRSRYE